MHRVFAILFEPAAYTVDRNRAVYNPAGIRYCYINGRSEAGADVSTETLSTMPVGKLAKRLRSILRGNDVVIVNGYVGKVFVMLWMLNLVYRRAIGMDSDTQLRIPSNPLKRFVKWAWLTTVFRNRHYYGLAGGTGSHKELFRHYGMAERRICLMPMMVNNAKFAAKPAQPVEKPDGVFRFLFVGRIIGVKNLEVMLDAFVSAFAGSGDVELRLVGRGDMLEELRRRYSAQRNIVFAGARFGDELTAEYHAASALVLPSSYEPWGLVVNEAMAAGLPVIVSDQVGAAHDLVEGRDTGFIFPYKDADKLAEQMRLLVEDTFLYRRYSQNAANLMKNYWNYDLYTKCLKEFIDKASKAV